MSETNEVTTTVATDRTIDPLMERVSQWVADRTTVDRETHEALELISTSNRSKLNLFRHVLGMKKAARLTKLHRFMDEIEGRLFDPETINSVKDPRVLLMMGDHLHKGMKEDQAFIERLDDVGVDPAIRNLLHNMQVDGEETAMVEKVKNIDPRKRETIRQLFDKIAANAEQNGAG